MWEPCCHKELSLSQQKDLPVHAGVRGGFGAGEGAGVNQGSSGKDHPYGQWIFPVQQFPPPSSQD